MLCVLPLLVALAALVQAADAPAASQPADPAKAPELKATVPADFVEHKAKGVDVTLKAPKHWKPQPVEGDAKLDLIADEKTGRAVNLVVTTSAKADTLQSAVKDLPAEIANGVFGSRMLKVDFVKLGGEPAIRLVWEAPSGSAGTLRVCQFQVLKNGKAYTLTYAAKQAEFDELLPTVEQVAVSMKVR
jgi:hypothetical protein